MKYNCVVLLGPTAVGKTSLGVRLADYFNWDIISADSRQTYKGLDLGSGKDLKEYTITKTDSSGKEYTKQIPYHLIDVATLDKEYNVYKYQSDFYRIFKEQTAQNKMPFVVGGTGMYVDSVVRGYDFVEVPENHFLREELEKLSLDELDEKLLSLKPNLHNQSDLLIRERVVRAIEIELYMKSDDCKNKREKMEKRPEINAFVIGTTINRELLRNNIKIRLDERIEEGMIEEVQNLHDVNGYSWERLEKLGLEYRYCSMFLQGKIETQEQMTQELYHSICQFAKRQETWFRGMEKKGVKILWLSPVMDVEERYKQACDLVEQCFK